MCYFTENVACEIPINIISIIKCTVLHWLPKYQHTEYLGVGGKGGNLAKCSKIILQGFVSPLPWPGRPLIPTFVAAGNYPLHTFCLFYIEWVLLFLYLMTKADYDATTSSALNSRLEFRFCQDWVGFCLHTYMDIFIRCYINSFL